jgi:hypothetical protein
MRFILVLMVIPFLLQAEERVEVKNGLLKVDLSSKEIQRYKNSRSAPTPLQKRVSVVAMPVYMPKEFIKNRDITIVADKNFYTISIPLKGALLMISGDRTYQQKVISGGEKLEKMMKLTDSKFMISEGIMGVDFQRHGVNYSLSVECDDPYEDSRCTKKSFLKKIYNDLILVGGDL